MSDEDKRGFVFHSSQGETELSIEEVKELASRKDPDGLYALGMAYLYGWDIEADEKLGYEYLEMASDRGQTEAMTLLVHMFMEGEYEGINPYEAATLSIKAAKDGIPEAQLYAGLAYMDGVSVRQDYEEAARYFRLAANQGNDEARVDLAYLIQEGLGTPKDEKKAFMMFRTAAKNGNVNGMFHLGICYEFGIGTKTDLAKCMEMYRKASDMGDPYSSERLGFILYEGRDGIEQDVDASFELFVKAANMGIPTSMHIVGLFYLQGISVEKDESEARKWLKMAADSGIEDAKEVLSELDDTPPQPRC